MSIVGGSELLRQIDVEAIYESTGEWHSLDCALVVERGLATVCSCPVRGHDPVELPAGDPTDDGDEVVRLRSALEQITRSTTVDGAHWIAQVALDR